MTHAFSGLFGGGGGPTTINVPAAPTPGQTLTPSVSPIVPSTFPAGGAQTPSFLGSAVLPPASGPGSTNQKRLLGS